MSPEDINRMFQEVANAIPQQADQGAAEIAQQTAAMAPGVAATGGTGGQGLGAYNYNRLIRPAVNPLRDGLILQGRQQALRQGIYDETQLAEENYETAQRNYRTRQREAAERARREAEAARQAAMRAYSSAASSPSSSPSNNTGSVSGINQVATQSSRSPSLTGAQQMFRAENPEIYTAGRIIQPLVPQWLQNTARSATNLYPLARIAGAFLGSR